MFLKALLVFIVCTKQLKLTIYCYTIDAISILYIILLAAIYVCLFIGPPLISLENGPVSVRVSTSMKTVYLHCPFIGNPSPTFAWYNGNGEFVLEGQKYRIHYNGTLEISDYSVSEVANYQCNVTNVHGSDSRYYGFQLWGEFIESSCALPFYVKNLS